MEHINPFFPTPPFPSEIEGRKSMTESVAHSSTLSEHGSFLDHETSTSSCQTTMSYSSEDIHAIFTGEPTPQETRIVNLPLLHKGTLINHEHGAFRIVDFQIFMGHKGAQRVALTMEDIPDPRIREPGSTASTFRLDAPLTDFSVDKCYLTPPPQSKYPYFLINIRFGLMQVWGKMVNLFSLN
jgi:hypothetical protein